MKHLPENNVVKFLKESIIPFENNMYGKGFKSSVYLTDGTYLPCVIFYNSAKIISLSIKSFKAEKSISSYNKIKSFVAKGNRLNAYDISKIEKSKFTFPTSIHRQIQGETSMGWTGFVVKMKDGKSFSFGTSLFSDFFHMPDNYSGDDAQEIVNHSYISKKGDICSLKSQMSYEENEYYELNVFRERTFFECFIDGL